MISLFHSFTEYFIPEPLHKDPYRFRVAKAFVIMFWFVYLVACTLYVLSLTTLFAFPPNISIGLIVGLAFIYLFKFKGSLIIFSNLFVAIYVSVLLPTIPSSGYLYSDNILWLIAAPLIALLYGNKISGILWFIFVGLYTGYSYRMTDDNQLEILKLMGKGQIFVSYTLLAITLYGIVLIFEKGLDHIIVLLRRQKHQLQIKRRQLEEQTRLLELQKNEIAQKNNELELIEQRLLLSNQELESFAFAASHDLKEPLRMIGMYTSLLKRQLDPNNTDSGDYMHFISDGVNRMQTLLDDLLNYSRLGVEPDRSKIANLNDVVFLVIHNLVATLKETETHIACETLPCVRLSRSELIQVFQNLIANAIKFRKPDIKPEIKIYSHDVGNFHQISIRDNGIGIKKEFHEKVFKIFERLHSRSEYEGSGIGLATVRKIVHKAGGNIWLESTEGVGTTFHFTLPKCSDAENQSVIHHSKPLKCEQNLIVG